MGKIKILCVNDSELNLFILKKAISKAGIAKEVIFVSDGQQALDYYLKFTENPQEEFAYPNLILLDINMPGMGGWEFLDRFEQTLLPLFQNTRVIITSFSNDEKDFERAKQYSFVLDFLNSPMTVDYLKQLRLPE